MTWGAGAVHNHVLDGLVAHCGGRDRAARLPDPVRPAAPVGAVVDPGAVGLLGGGTADHQLHDQEVRGGRVRDRHDDQAVLLGAPVLPHLQDSFDPWTRVSLNSPEKPKVALQIEVLLVLHPLWRTRSSFKSSPLITPSCCCRVGVVIVFVALYYKIFSKRTQAAAKAQPIAKTRLHSSSSGGGLSTSVGSIPLPNEAELKI